ncbi:MAG: NUDIX domain-containing protein [Anaerolineaceae bacterium]|nr:NUDIX domain-containing protein [Anaerolineaceae bacterium]
MGKEDQGVFSDRYQIIPRTLIFITKQDEILLLKGAPDKRLWANCYNGIGGHIEQGEDIYSAAKRELDEETGLKIDQLKLCAIVMIDTDKAIGIGMFVFRGKYTEGVLKESSEGKLEWINIEAVSKFDLVEDLPILIPSVLALGDDAEPLSILYCYDENDQLNIVIK